jgi:hypothetical protein
MGITYYTALFYVDKFNQIPSFLSKTPKNEGVGREDLGAQPRVWISLRDLRREVSPTPPHASILSGMNYVSSLFEIGMRTS